jgi:hypothetical protein
MIKAVTGVDRSKYMPEEKLPLDEQFIQFYTAWRKISYAVSEK